jgi:hypothetical protein
MKRRWYFYQKRCIIFPKIARGAHITKVPILIRLAPSFQLYLFIFSECKGKAKSKQLHSFLCFLT